MLIATPVLIHRHDQLLQIPTNINLLHPLRKKTRPFGMSHIRRSLNTENLSRKTEDIILQSWRHSTQKQYSTHLKKWFNYCAERNESPTCSPIAVCLEFFTNMYEQGLSYSSMNTAKSAIATIHNPCANSSIVSWFLKGAFNMRPALPRYTCTFDAKIVLDYLEQLQFKDMQLNILSSKLCLLLLVLSRQRVQTLQVFDIDNIYSEDTRCTLYINKILKTSKPGRHKSCVQFNCYEDVTCVLCIMLSNI